MINQKVREYQGNADDADLKEQIIRFIAKIGDLGFGFVRLESDKLIYVNSRFIAVGKLSR